MPQWPVPLWEPPMYSGPLALRWLQGTDPKSIISFGKPDISGHKNKHFWDFFSMKLANKKLYIIFSWIFQHFLKIDQIDYVQKVLVFPNNFRMKNLILDDCDRTVLMEQTRAIVRPSLVRKTNLSVQRAGPMPRPSVLIRPSCATVHMTAMMVPMKRTLAVRKQKHIILFIKWPQFLSLK